MVNFTRTKRARLMLLTLLCSFFALQIGAQTAKEVFLKMPASVCPYLTENNKADLPDFIEAGMTARVKNKFEEWTEMTKLTNDSLELKIGESVFMRLTLPLMPNGQRAICLTYTMQLPAETHWIRYFTTGWKEWERVFAMPAGALHK